MKGSPGDKKNMTMWVIVLVVIVLIVAGLILASRRRKAGMLGGAEGRKASHMMLPAGKGPHTHLVDLDESGYGISTEDMGHRHVVDDVIDVGLSRDGEIAPADHHHDIKEFIVST